uniref:Baculoviral IAP repeat containing 5 n=1 Tax=Podarcis muralis TaxID=64176 RepID=A0A670J214_PODMU
LGSLSSLPYWHLTLHLNQNRLSSFACWPFKENCKCTPESMARAGLIHCPGANEPDLAKCFFCLIELEGWEPDHDVVHTWGRLSGGQYGMGGSQGICQYCILCNTVLYETNNQKLKYFFRLMEGIRRALLNKDFCINKKNSFEAHKQSILREELFVFEKKAD